MAINIRNGSKIDEMGIVFTNIFHFQDTPTFTQIGIFGLKIYHLATLSCISVLAASKGELVSS
jgi:hypothetical protein